MNDGEPIPPHLRSLARFASLTGARPAPGVPPGEGDLTERFLALATDRGMFRAETNLRFILSEEPHGTRFIHLGVNSQSAHDEAAAIVSELRRAHGREDIATMSAGRIDAGRVPFIEVRSPVCDFFTPSGPPRLLAAYFDEGVLADALQLACDLRREGLGCWFFHDVKNLAKHLRLADRFGAGTVIIVGGREWDLPERSVAIRCTTSKEERVVPLAHVVSDLMEHGHRGDWAP